MWDIGRPLKMLKTLRYDPFSLQHIIDVDKYIASSNEGRDLCRKYMQYCSFCNKQVKNPCASAYLAGSHYNSVCRLINQCFVTELPVIQAITDIDKYLISETVGFDVCGKYAPFCKLCNKGVPNPCAAAYLKYSTGYVGEPEKSGQTVIAEEVAVAAYQSDEPAEEVVCEPVQSVEEVAETYEPQEPAKEVVYKPEQSAKPMRRLGIKIATARRRPRFN